MTQTISICLLAVLATGALAQYGGYEHKYEYKEEPYDPHPKYKFEYSVHDPHTYDIHSQKEERDGDYVKGYYELVEPDGGKRTVHYTADHKTGFNAVVHREHNKHPYHYETPKYEHKPKYEYKPKNEPPKYEYKPKYEAPKYEYKPSYKTAYSSSSIYKPGPTYKYEAPKYEEHKYEAPKYEEHKYEEPKHSYKPSYSSSSFSTYHYTPKY